MSFKLELDKEKNETIIRGNYTGIGFETDSGDKAAICERDGGFELNYGGKWYRLNGGQITFLRASE